MANEDILSGLRSSALQAANDLLAAYPMAVLTSGKRDIQKQADDMAEDIIKAGDRTWVSRTYASSPVSIACQAWIDLHPEATSLQDLSAGLYAVLGTFSPEDLHHLSWHLTGDAFDVEPVTGPTGDAISMRLQALVNNHIAAGGSAKYLTREGGLVRWHVQFSPDPADEVTQTV